MMNIFQIRLISTVGQHYLSSASGSLFHGYLNHIFSEELSARLHTSGVPLYHQKIKYFKQTIDWQIISFDDEISKTIRQKLLNHSTIYLKNKSMSLTVLSAIEIFNQPLNDWLITMQSRDIRGRDVYLRFSSPTSHKVQGEYINQFDLEVAYKHIIYKLNTLQNYFSLANDSIGLLLKGTEIVSNDIKKSAMYLKGIKIPAYSGELRLRWIGTEDNLAIFNLLWLFAELSGVGIKTAMGYGNVEVI